MSFVYGEILLLGQQTIKVLLDKNKVHLVETK